jgi:hypothetical protein
MEQDTLMGIDSEQDELLELVRVDQATTFREGFWHWLRDNWGIWKRFQIEADKVRGRGRAHYSARTIGEFIRHETALRENSTFKCNDHVWPDLARLFMLVRKCPGFFELRGR